MFAGLRGSGTKIPDNVQGLFNAIEEQRTAKPYSEIEIGTLAAAHNITDKKMLDAIQTEKGYESLNKRLQQSTTLIGSIKNGMSSVLTIGKSILSGVVAGIITTAVFKGLELIGTLIYNIVMAEEIAIKKGKEATEAINNTIDTFNEKTKKLSDINVSVGLSFNESDINKSLKSLTDRYFELSVGVKSIDNSNMKLSNDEYQEYLDISNKLNDVYPSLKKGTDAHGNAILDLGKNSEEAAKKLMDMHDAEMLSANVDISKNIQTSIDGLMTQINKSQDLILELQDAKDKYVDEIGKIQDDIDNISDGGLFEPESSYGFSIVGNSITLDNYSEEADRIIGDYFSERGIAIQKEIGLQNEFLIFVDGLADLMENDHSLEQSLTDYYKNSIRNAMANVQSEEDKVDFDLITNQNYIIDAENQIKDVVKSYLSTSKSFGVVGEKIRDAILQNLEISVDTLKSDKYSGKIIPYIYGEFINDATNIGPDVQEKINKVLEIDYHNMDKPMLQVVESMRSSLIKAVGKDSWMEWADLLGLNEFRREQMQIKEDIVSRAEELFGYLSNEQKQFINKLNPKELQEAYDTIFSGSFDKWEDFTNALNTPKISKDGLFSEVLTSVTAEAEVIEKKISAINTAIQSVNENGSVSQGTKELLEAIPNLDSSAYNDVISLRKEGAKYLSDWIDLLYKEGETANLSAEEYKKLNDYVLSLAQTYKDFGISDQNISTLIMDKFVQNTGNATLDDYLYQKGESLLSQINQEFSDELSDQNKRIMIYAAIDAITDPLELTIENVRKNYEKMSIPIEITANIKKFEKDAASIERKISSLQSNVSYTEQLKSLDNAKGINSNDEEYYDSMIKDKEAQLALIDQQIANLRNPYNKEGIIWKINNGGIKAGTPEFEKAIQEQVSKYDELRANKLSLYLDIEGLLDEKDLIPYTLLENKLSVLKSEADKLSESLNKNDKAQTIDNYRDAIENAAEQIGYLNEERDYWEEKLNDSNVEEDGEKYFEYKQKLAEVDSQIKTLTNSQQEWQNAISSFTLNNVITSLEEYEAHLDKIIEEQDNFESLGGRLTQDDYQRRIDGYEYEAKQSFDIAQDYARRMDDLSRIGGSGSNEYNELLKEYESNMKKYRDDMQKIGETNQKIDLLPVEALDRELSKIQEESSKIQRTIDESHFGATPEMLNNQKDNLSSQISIMEQMYDEYISLEEKYNDQKRFSIADDMHNEAMSIRDEINELNDQILDINIDIDMRPYNELETEMSRLESEASVLEQRLSNIDYADGEVANKIRESMETNIVERMQTTRSKIKQLEEEMEKAEIEAQENGKDISDYRSNAFDDMTYQEMSNTVDELTNSYEGLSAELKNLKKEIDATTLNKLQKELERIEAEEALHESELNIKASLGLVVDEDSIQRELDLAIKNAETRNKIVLDAKVKLDNAQIATEIQDKVQNDNKFNTFFQNSVLPIFNQESMDEKIKDDETELNNAQADANNAIAEVIQKALDSAKVNVDKAEAELQSLENVANETRNTISNITDQGFIGTSQLYKEAINNNANTEQAMMNHLEALQAQKDAIENQLSSQGINEFYLSGDWNDIVSKIEEAKQAMVELNKETLDYKLMVNGGIDLFYLQDQMANLEKVNQEINNSISIAESRSQMITPDIFQSLADNVTEQINNIQQQNIALEQQQSIVGDNKAKFDELDGAIRSNNNTILELTQNLESYLNELLHFATNSATNLRSSISTALQESLSETGVSNAAMQSLIGQFKQLEKFTSMDLSSVFINSAKGVKINANAIKQLAKIQRTVYSKSLFNSILKGQQAVFNATKKQVAGEKAVRTANFEKAKTARKGDQAYLEGAAAKLRAINKEITGYNAIMDAIELSMSGYQKWQDAMSTENPGDKYKNIYDAMADMEIARNQGLVGTDEFKAFVSMLDPWNRDTADAYDDLYVKMERYFFDTNEGMKNFANDLVQEGFGTLTDGMYDFDLSNLKAISDRFGLSIEAIEYMLGRLEDYGFNIVKASNQLEATAKVIETEDDLFNEIVRTNELKSNGANEDAVRESQEKQNIYRENLAEYRTMQDVFANEKPVSENDYNAWINSIIEQRKQYYEMLDDGDDRAQDWYARIQGFAKDKGIKLNAELQIMSPGYDEWIEDYEQKLQEASEYLPDLSDIDYSNVEQRMTASYKNAFDELKELVSQEKILFDWDFDPTDENHSINALQSRLAQLQSLEIDAEVNPQAQAALDAIIKSTENELNLRYVLENANSGTGISLEDLASMTDDQKKEIIMNAVTLTDEQTQNLLQYINGKQAKMPLKVQFDQTTINAFAELLGKETVQIDKIDVANDAVTSLNDQIQQNVKPVEIGFNLNDSAENYRNEVMRISSYSLNEYKDDILGLNTETKYGNIDMNNRKIITWDEDTKSKYANALNSWNYNPDISSIDTVYGTSMGFGEQGHEIEIAFSPILQTENGAEFLDKDTVTNYIKRIVGEATESDGTINVDKLFELDASDLSLLAEAGDKAREVASLMHFSGDFGAISLAINDLITDMKNAGATTEELQSKINEITFSDITEKFRLGEVLNDDELDTLYQFAAIYGITIDQVVEQLNVARESMSQFIQSTEVPEDSSGSGGIFVGITQEADATAQSIATAKENYEELKTITQEELQPVIIVETDTTSADQTIEESKTNASTSVTSDFNANPDEYVTSTNEAKTNAGTPTTSDLNANTEPFKMSVNQAKTDAIVPVEIPVNANIEPLKSQLEYYFANSTFGANVQANITTSVAPVVTETPVQLAHGTLSAYAQGTGNDVAISKDQDALVNELGTESIIFKNVTLYGDIH